MAELDSDLQHLGENGVFNILEAAFHLQFLEFEVSRAITELVKRMNEFVVNMAIDH
jgi:hypothetical protein